MRIIDHELGEIQLVQNSRARSVTARYKEGFFRVSYPPYMNEKQLQDLIRQMKPKLLNLKEKAIPRIIFTPQTQFETFSFKLEIKQSAHANYYVQLKDGNLSIICPEGTEYEDAKVQNLIRTAIENALRYEAKRIFPSRVKALAHRYGFTYEGVKINKSRSRWGSCSSQKSINLSYYCMLLPEYLIDFVILHELCHTIEMNHGNHFWQLLDKVSEGKSEKLTNELRRFKTQI